MSDSARERILQRLRTARAGVRLPRTPEVAVAAPDTAAPEAALPRFLAEAAALGIECHVAPAVSDVHRQLAARVAGRRVLTWSPEHLPYDVATLLSDAMYADAPYDRQATAEIGVTGCDVAIAETASLVLFSAPGRSRTVSLLPPAHVAIVQRRQLCFSMDEFLNAHAGRIRDFASCTFITGPSRTADIELTLTLGIHGPGSLTVIVGP